MKETRNGAQNIIFGLLYVGHHVLEEAAPAQEYNPGVYWEVPFTYQLRYKPIMQEDATYSKEGGVEDGEGLALIYCKQRRGELDQSEIWKVIAYCFSDRPLADLKIQIGENANIIPPSRHSKCGNGYVAEYDSLYSGRADIVADLIEDDIKIHKNRYGSPPNTAKLRHSEA